MTKVISYSDPMLDLWERFMRTRNLMYKVFVRDLRTLGLKPEQLGILNIVSKAGNNITPAAISRIYRREPHTVSVNLNRMRQKGLLNLGKDLYAKNMIRVELTEYGAYVLEEGLKRKDGVSRLFASFKPEELAQIDQFILRLDSSAEKILKEHDITASAR